MKTTKKRTKLTLSEVETQMEVLTKEEMNQLKGGIGDVIIDPNGIVAQLKSDLSARISYLESILSSWGIRDMGTMPFDKIEIESTLNEYKAALSEINELEQAEETYHFSYGSDARAENRNGTIYATVPYENQDVGLVGHELKHMYQYHTGGLVKGCGNETYGYDIQDEIEAYRRQDIINHGANYFKGNLERKAEDIRKMLDEKGCLIYPNL